MKISTKTRYGLRALIHIAEETANDEDKLVRIKEISDSLGINLITTHYKKENHGEALLKICKKRNDLAHGVYSFSDIGKDITYNGTVVTSGTTPLITNFGLKHFKQFTEEHLEKYIESVENFIRLKSYKQISSV